MIQPCPYRRAKPKINLAAGSGQAQGADMNNDDDADGNQFPAKQRGVQHEKT